MSSKAKIKGSAWEREICNKLSNALGGSFTRSMNSGAYIGGSNSFRKGNLAKNQISAMKGDIIPPDEYPLLNIEAKNYKDILFHQIIDGCCSTLNGWIDQTEEPADENDVSFTIFKITRKGSWIAYRKEMCNEFELESYSVYKKDGIEYIVTSFDVFLKNNAEKIKELASPKI